MFDKIILQLHGSGGSSGSSTSQWKPNDYQKTVLEQMVPQYSNYLNTSNNLLGAANNLYSGLATQNVDYNSLLNTAQNANNTAMSGFSNLSNGNVAGYTENETNALQTTLNNTMGTTLNKWANNGVINSSVATQGLNSIANQAASTAASDYNNALSNANTSLTNLQASGTNAISNASTAQNAAQIAASNLLTDSLSGYNASSGILGTNGSTTTNSSSNGSGSWLSALASIGGAAAAACFTEDTKIKTQTGEKSIKDIKVGDKVMSYEDGELVPREVTEIQVPVKKEIVEVVAEKDNQRYFVETTETQPFLGEDGEFHVVGTMPIGTELKHVGKVIAIFILGEDYVYDLRVAGNNTYIANGYVAYGRF